MGDPGNSLLGAYERAELLIDEAVQLGYLPESRVKLPSEAEKLVRLDYHSAVILRLEKDGFEATPKRLEHWVYADLFGYLARLATFEISYGAGWSELLKRFRVYFGRSIDSHMASIFLAASTRPDILMSKELILDVRRLCGALCPGETAPESLGVLSEDDGFRDVQPKPDTATATKGDEFDEQ